ncbi:hypothetical protein BDP81DRAFT_422855 [Colletotrichum phormii]|uniref:Uncharacterized protein n=1 Tax=Colletotrichum phormii TaxID=359342 RepID=A0AAI9ZVA0_9PEZI|nr:uncharacterized protein BDP81DRAFT_422855 [Colletotrichum phormii]KAK1638854.1 hypothetical protein BDP81DRAFT_422855 [Colletotrichum phormii]
MSDSEARSDEGKIADSIWGPCESDQVASARGRRLAGFLTYCTQQRPPPCVGQPSAVDPSKEIVGAIRLLKSSPLIQKDVLLNQESTEMRNVASIESAVRMMLVTECESEGTIAMGTGNIYRWGRSETLVGYLGRVYTQSTSIDIPKDPIDHKNLRCYILTRDAGIKIQQTEKLSDHLYLNYGTRTKVLSVFSHKAFLECSRETLKATRPDLTHTVEEALSLGCLPPKLIEETLRTYNLSLLIGSARSRRGLQDWVKRENLDTSLLTGSTGLSKKDSPRTLYDLYEDFPYWTSQLARLLEEVDEPTPSTRWEIYAERRSLTGIRTSARSLRSWWPPSRGCWRPYWRQSKCGYRTVTGTRTLAKLYVDHESSM